MTHYHHPNTSHRTNVDDTTWDSQPDIAWGLPQRVQTPPPSTLGADNSSPPVHEQQPQDNKGRRKSRQRYTYIPSTSSISPGRNYQIPSVVPGTPFFQAYPGFIPDPPHVPESYTPRPPDPKTFDPYEAYTVPPILPHQADIHQRYTFPTTESIFDDASFTKYTSVNPFQSHGKPKAHKTSLPVAYDHPDKDVAMETPEYVVYTYSHRRTVLLALLVDFLNLTFHFFYDSLPRQVYLHVLLRLPSFYWSRVARIFEEAEMTMAEIEDLALQAMGSIAIPQLQWSSPAGANLKVVWESFIDSLLREWKTLNIVSVLLLSAILTILQIDAAGSDPIARNCALISLICALMSLLYGCMYIIRFASMRKTYKALEWAQMAQKSKTFIWWNVWVLLALPAVWLAWSLMLYIACVMAFVWRTGTSGLETTLVLSKRAELAIRITISVVLGIGVLYFALIMNTLRRYGDSMDQQFKKELDRLVREKRRERPSHGYGTAYPSYHNPYYGNVNPAGSFSLAKQNGTKWFKRAKVMDLRFQAHQAQVSNSMPDYLIERGFTPQKWEKFISEAYSAWIRISPISGPFSVSSNPPRPQDNVVQLLEKWNRKYFQPRSTLGVLCHEYIDLFPDSPSFSIYVVDMTPIDNESILIAERFGPVPRGLSRIDIFDQPGQCRTSTRRILGRTSIYLTRNPMDGRVRFPQDDPLSPSDPDTTNGYSQRVPENLPPLRGKNLSKIPSTRSEASFRAPISNKYHRPFLPAQPAIVNPYRPQHNSVVTPISHLSAPPPTLPGTHVRPLQPVTGPPPRNYPSLYGGYYHVPSSSTPGPVWGGPLSSSLNSGPEPFNMDAWFSHPSPDSRKRRSRTLSPPRQGSRNRSRSLPLPAVSPDYSWSAWQDLAPPAPSTNRTVTPSALSNLEILRPPFVHNQQPVWTTQYQPSLPRTPRYNEPRPSYMNMVDDGNTQSWYPPTSNVRSRHAHRHTRRNFQPQDPLTTQPAASSPPVADSPRQSSPALDDDVSTRHRSTSTSHGYYSRSPSPEQDPLRLSSPVHGRRQSQTQFGAEDSQQLSGTYNDEVPHRGRDHTPRYERTRMEPQALADMGRGGPESVQASWQPDSVHNSINHTVVGPWTMDHLSLRIILNP